MNKELQEADENDKCDLKWRNVKIYSFSNIV